MRFGGRGRQHVFSMKMASKLLQYPPPTVQRWMRTCCQSGNKSSSPRPMCQTKRAALGKASNANQVLDDGIDISCPRHGMDSVGADLVDHAATHRGSQLRTCSGHNPRDGLYSSQNDLYQTPRTPQQAQKALAP